MQFFVIAILAFLFSCFLMSQQQNLEILARKHYQQCDCLISTGEPFERSLEIGLGDCWSKCFTNNNCYAFEFSDHSKACKLFEAMGVGYNPSSVQNENCIKYPQIGFFQFYIIKRKENGQTFDCEVLKTNNPLANDSYYEIKVRGIPVTAFCLMTDSPAKTYIDVEGVSVWGGSMYLSKHPVFKITRTWTRVQIRVTECMALVICDDQTFSEMQPYYDGETSPSFIVSQNFGHGGNCALDSGEFEVDLTLTPFFIPNGTYFIPISV